MNGRIISERTSAGLAAAKARGRVGGRPTVMTAERIAVAHADEVWVPKDVLERDTEYLRKSEGHLEAG
ncbi:MAG: hypothetical protein WD405_06875 [Homoserinimonas sp.]